jgi:putative Mn2+ efflux pump MntP
MRKECTVNYVEIALIGVGLSMDAFAVAICKGLGMKRVNMRHALVIALFFGGFQALMPFLGWALGTQFASLVEPVDHWIAFGLLLFVGGKMLWDAFHEDDDQDENEFRLDIPELFMLAIATSIDALAVGVSFAFLRVDIAPAISIIGCITFALSLVGVVVGNRFGARYERPSTIAGGIVLILLGFKILLEHLGVLVL